MSSGNLKFGLRLPGPVVRAEAQVLVGPVGIDHLARVHLPLRVPDGLELAERLHQLLAVHLRQEEGLGLAVAVLGGEGAAVLDDEVRGLIEELHVIGDAFPGEEIEGDAAVDAALAEMAVEGSDQAELVEQLAELPEIVADLVGPDRRVLPSGPGQGKAGNIRGCAQARLAHLPDLLFLGVVIVELHGRRLFAASERVHAPAGVPVRFLFAPAAELDHEPAVARRQELSRNSGSAPFCP